MGQYYGYSEVSGVKSPLEAHLDKIESKLDKLLAKKNPVKPRTSKKHEYSAMFELCWGNYPKVSGANKQKAYAQFCQRLKEGEKSEVMLDETIAYYKLCKATDRRVMLPATFYGRDKHFNCDWTIPTQADNVPTKNEDLTSWAAEKGLPGPNVGESWANYRNRLQSML